MENNSILFVAAAALAMLATSCTKENENPRNEVKQMPITITAEYDGSNAKVSYTESGSNITATWEDSDEILVVYDGYVSTLTLSSGAGTASATFTGTISYRTAPTANSLLSCYVRDQNNASAVTVDGNTIVYSDAAFQSQDGTLASAAKCNTYFGMATYGDGTNIRCDFAVNTSMCKFNYINVDSDNGRSATVEYKSNGTTLASATITVHSGSNLVYLAVPSGSYSGEQKLVYTCAASSTVKEYNLSSTSANFVAGHTYSKNIAFTNPITWNSTTIREINLRGETLSTGEIDGVTATLSGEPYTYPQWKWNTLSNRSDITCRGTFTLTFSSEYTFWKIEITCDEPDELPSGWRYSDGKLVWDNETPATSITMMSHSSIDNVSQIVFSVLQ